MGKVKPSVRARCAGPSRGLVGTVHVGLHLVLQEIILRLHYLHVWAWLGSRMDSMIRLLQRFSRILRRSDVLSYLRAVC